MTPAADAALMLWAAPGHSGLSITATPVGVRKIKRVSERNSCGKCEDLLSVLYFPPRDVEKWPVFSARTCIAAPVAHVCGDEAPLVDGRVVKLYGGEVAGAVVSSDHVQQPVDGTDALRTKNT